MKRILLAFLLLALVTLLVPSLRERMQPRIDQGREWLGTKLERPLAPVLNRYRRLKTESQISKTINELIRRRNMGMPPPTANELGAFMSRYDFAPHGLDAWGMPFRLIQGPDSLTLVSAGADLAYETGDDVLRSVRYHDPGRRVRRSPRR